MDNWDPIQMRILWYVLAGFVLGFITSTLWEWLYYRKQRLRWRTPGADARGATTAWGAETSRQETMAADTDEGAPWAAPVYRSPGVFLESEQEPARPQHPANSAAAVSPAFVPPSPSEEISFSSAAAQSPRAATIDSATPTTVDLTPRLEVARSPVEPQPSTDHPSSLPAPASAPATFQPRTPPTPTLVVEAVASARNPQPSATTPVSDNPPPRSTGYPDDLTKIQGIGEAYKRRLYAAGLYTWQQIANSDAETLRTITKAKPNARPDDWKERALALAQKSNRLAAIYGGPLPDDLTKVNGIGPSYADSLYRAGICTYEQLATVDPAELAAILPTPAIGTEFNFPDWIKQAAQLAQIKQKHTSLFA